MKTKFSFLLLISVLLYIPFNYDIFNKEIATLVGEEGPAGNMKLILTAAICPVGYIITNSL